MTNRILKSNISRIEYQIESYKRSLSNRILQTPTLESNLESNLNKFRGPDRISDRILKSSGD